MVALLDKRNFSAKPIDEDRITHLNSLLPESTPSFVSEGDLRIRSLSTLTGNPTEISGGQLKSSDESMIDRAHKAVTQFSASFGFEPNQVVEFIPDLNVNRTTSGSHVVYLQQHHMGIPLFEMHRAVHFDSNGAIRAIHGDSSSLDGNVSMEVKLDAAAAAQTAATHIFETWGQAEASGWELDGAENTESPPEVAYEPVIEHRFDLPSEPSLVSPGPFARPVYAHLVLFDQGELVRISWFLSFVMPGETAAYDVIIAAGQDAPGEVLYCNSRMCTLNVEGLVYTHNPKENADRSSVAFPPDQSQYPEFLSHLANFPSENSWVNDTETIGNYTTANLGFVGPALAGQPDGDKVNFSPSEGDGDDQKVLNIFYFCNYMHNFFYALGFDEASGNFQRRHEGSEGVAGDPVTARAHSGAVQGTANMLTPIDGSSPIMNMGLVEATNRHTAFDSDVVFHEFVHGVTNRLVGGRSNSTALSQPQSRGMGEGWSDYFALSLQNYFRNAEKVVSGDWLANRPEGIRGFPYDEGFPDGFEAMMSGRYADVAVPHPRGEIWCATLMSATRRAETNLGDKKKAYAILWQVVVDGLKLTPPNPSFLDARNAILTALDDLKDINAITDDEHHETRKACWTAFAKFGMGTNAQSPFGAQLISLVGDNSLPPDLALGS